MEFEPCETPLLDEICSKFRYLAFLEGRKNHINEFDQKIDNKKKQYMTFMLSMTTIVPSIVFGFLLFGIGINFPNTPEFLFNILAILFFVPFIVTFIFFCQFVSYNSNKGHLKYKGFPDYSNSFYSKLFGLQKRWEAKLKNDQELKYLVDERQCLDYMLYTEEVVNKIYDNGEIHKNYASVYTLTWLYIYLTTGRASSAKEAINLFESEEQQARANGMKSRNYKNWQSVQETMKKTLTMYDEMYL
ncbi:hypothetical protein [Vagococcus hydrophili]|uniref:Uncharacterized protein n=1 Tax=Vagococcus hydrophili TaxID=2714947 RepID=A0A6G8ASL5_9ENTE|nr:hypothetical protein [Vagococcus hydrophili]QIL48068.1 hypothetical protein G7082_05860 [Vagococcus hydrophili]